MDPEIISRTQEVSQDLESSRREADGPGVFKWLQQGSVEGDAG